MSRSKRSYSNEFRKDAISLALRSPSVKEAADSLGIPEGTLNAWVRDNIRKAKDGTSAEVIDLAAELKKLKKENARLREEKEILKKAATFFARESK